MARAEWITMEELFQKRDWCYECHLNTNLHVTYFVTTASKTYLDTIEWCENCAPADWEDDDGRTY